MQKQVTKTINSCDKCNRDVQPGLLNKCPVCKREICNSCTQHLYDIYDTDICRDCYAKPEIEELITNFHKEWLQKRKEAIELLENMNREN